MSYSVASLFAGIGGIDKGFEQAGANVVWANEIDKNACLTYRENFNHELVEEDIRKVNENEMPNVDIITAGWPCVAFSVAGNRHGMKYKCLSCQHEHSVTYEEYINNATCPKCLGETEAIDPRGTLFFDVIRFIRAKKPQTIFLENVKNLKGHDKGNTFKVIEQMLRESGYHITSKIMNTMEYGNIPQNRERIFIVGFRDVNKLDAFTWPEKLKLTNTINTVLERSEKQSDEYYYTKQSQYYSMISKSMKRTDTVYQLRRIYIRENQSNVCPTLTANMGTGGHNVPLIVDNWGFRKLTPKETLKLQGFPVDSDFTVPNSMAKSHLYKQAGNAVSVPVVKRIAEKIINAIDIVNQHSEKKIKDTVLQN